MITKGMNGAVVSIFHSASFALSSFSTTGIVVGALGLLVTRATRGLSFSMVKLIVLLTFAIAIATGLALLALIISLSLLGYFLSV